MAFLRGSYGPYPDFDVGPLARKRYVDAVVKRAGLWPGDRVLDVAAGHGTIANALANRFTRCRVATVEMAAEAIGVARKNAEVEGCTGRLDILNADPFDLPFEEETFQLTTCAFGLTFEEDLEDVLDEMFRVTDYMGRVFIVDADFTRAKVTPAGATGLVFAPETLAMMKELGYGKLQVSRVDTLRDGTVINLLAAKRFDPEGEEGDGDDENDDGKDAE